MWCVVTVVCVVTVNRVGGKVKPALEYEEDQGGQSMKKYGEKQEVRQDRDGVGGAWSRWLVAVVCVLLSVQSGDSQDGWWEGRARASDETTLRSDFYPGACLSANDFYPSLLIF